MQYLPELDNNRRFLGKTFILGSLLEGMEVEGLLAADHLLKLFGEEHFDHAASNHSVEAFLKGIELLFNVFIEEPLCIQLHVLFLVVVGYRDGGAVRFKVVSLLHSVTLAVHLKVQIKSSQTILRIEYLLEALMDCRLDIGQLFEVVDGWGVLVFQKFPV